MVSARIQILASVLAFLLAAPACGGGGGDSLPSEPGDIDCSACGTDLCWYDYDIDEDGYVAHCAAWPAQCDTDRNCDCLNTETDSDGDLFCEEFGVQNSNACELVNGRPLIYCETNLG